MSGCLLPTLPQHFLANLKHSFLRTLHFTCYCFSNLQDYVRERVMQFSPPFASRISPGAGLQQIQQAAHDVLQSLPPPDYTGALATRDLQLVFRHDCQ